MRVGILGAGAIGSLVGAFIKQAGFDVVLVDPFEAHMKKIREEGLDANVIAKQLPVKVGVGSTIFEILLWVLGIIPGVIFLFMGLFT